MACGRNVLQLIASNFKKSSEGVIAKLFSYNTVERSIITNLTWLKEVLMSSRMSNQGLHEVLFVWN